MNLSGTDVSNSLPNYFPIPYSSETYYTDPVEFCFRIQNPQEFNLHFLCIFADGDSRFVFPVPRFAISIQPHEVSFKNLNSLVTRIFYLATKLVLIVSLFNVCFLCSRIFSLAFVAFLISTFECPHSFNICFRSSEERRN
jgi:hypothetical protein